MLKKNRKRIPSVRVSNVLTREAKWEAWNVVKIRALFWTATRIHDISPKHPILHHLDLDKLCEEMNLEYVVNNWNLDRLVHTLGDGIAKAGIRFYDEKQRKYVWYNLIRSMEFYLDSKTFTIKFNTDALRWLQNLERDFTIVYPGQVSRLVSVRAIRMYLLLSSMRDLKADAMRIFPLQDLRFMFNLQGDAYNRWDNLERALMRTQEEVATKVKGLDFKVVPIKEGNRVVATRFDPIQVKGHQKFLSGRRKHD